MRGCNKQQENNRQWDCQDLATSRRSDGRTVATVVTLVPSLPSSYSLPVAVAVTARSFTW